MTLTACILVIFGLFPACRPSVEKIARSFLGEFTNTLQKGQDGKWTSELTKVFIAKSRVSCSNVSLYLDDPFALAANPHSCTDDL